MGLRDTVAKRRAERAKPKSLAELKARKAMAELKTEKPPEPPKTLAELKRAKQAKKSARLDFRRGGVKYHNVQQIDGYWTIDVTNGDRTFTLHNKHGAWFYSRPNKPGYLAEPVAVARALGTDLSQLAITQALTSRLDRELKDRGIPTREERLRQREEEALAARRKARKTTDD
jgi:hypothetical protein